MKTVVIIYKVTKYEEGKIVRESFGHIDLYDYHGFKLRYDIINDETMYDERFKVETILELRIDEQDLDKIEYMTTLMTDGANAHPDARYSEV